MAVGIIITEEEIINMAVISNMAVTNNMVVTMVTLTLVVKVKAGQWEVTVPIEARKSHKGVKDLKIPAPIVVKTLLAKMPDTQDQIYEFFSYFQNLTRTSYCWHVRSNYES